MEGVHVKLPVFSYEQLVRLTVKVIEQEVSFIYTGVYHWIDPRLLQAGIGAFSVQEPRAISLTNGIM